MIDAMNKSIRWATITGFPGYQVGDHGFVKRPNGTIMQRCMHGGYLVVHMRDDSGKHRNRSVRALVLAAFGPKRPSGWKSRNKGSVDACGINDIEWYRPVYTQPSVRKKRAKDVRKALSGRVSASFSPDQVKMLDNIVHALRHGRDARTICRQDEHTLGDLAGITARMRASATRRAQLREKGERSYLRLVGG